jgi:hypothetical protein
MNREERRHPEKQPTDTKTPREKPPHPAEEPQDEAAARAKSHRHKKSTADKWNQ